MAIIGFGEHSLADKVFYCKKVFCMGNKKDAI